MDIDHDNRILNINHQLQRSSDMRYIIETTKNDEGTRKIQIIENMAQIFQVIIYDRESPKTEELKLMEEFKKSQA